ncbi:MAG: sulfatase-like hydrolase/transferase [Acidimicrobiia bacterium]
MAKGGLSRFVRAWTCSVVLIYGLFSVGGDKLAFHSGALTVLYVLSALATLGAVALWAAGALIDAGLRRIRPRRTPAPGRILVLVLGVALVVSLTSRFTARLSDAQWLLLLAAVSGLGGLALRRVAPDSPMFGRASRLAQVTTALGVSVVVVGLVSSHMRHSGASHPGRAVLLVIVDGFPTELLNTYNAAESRTAFDRLADEALVFDRAYTNHVYTSAFFRELYTGELAAEADPSRPVLTQSENLLGALQGHGTAVRYVVSHQNAVPETNRLTTYSGFRSQLLSARYRGLARFLGLDYHLFAALDDTRSGLKRGVPWLLDPLDDPEEEAELISTVVPDEFRRMRSQGGNALLIVHGFSAPASADKLGDPSARAVDKLNRYAEEHDKEYLPEHATGLEQLRRLYHDRLEFWGTQLREMLARLRSSGALEDALVIVTADHGTSLREGRLGYGYHANPPATRVPLLMLGPGVEPGRVPAVVDTRDLVHTLAAHSSSRAVDLAPGGRDLLAWKEFGPRVAASMALPSVQRHEVLLAVHTPEAEYLFNLPPDGDGRALRGPVGGFDSPSDPVDSLDTDLAAQVRELLAGYRYAARQIGFHPRIEALLNPESGP